MKAPLDLNTLAAASMHELKNLLGELTLSLDHIAHIGCPGADDQIGSARFVCRRISGKLVEMLTLYKLEDGQWRPTIEHHSPADFVEDLAQEARSLAAGRLAVSVETHAAPPFGFFDRDLVQSALLNALHNALHYARHRITLSATLEADDLVFRVGDDGPGFPAELLGAALDAPRASRHGTGLGLCFASSVARAHGDRDRRGRVALSNIDGGGALFSLCLP